ncbi:CDGSH iron-sulfur domain-containing protein [Gordonia sp. ABSL1-1]|uniref:CDGSH iron-sulfur domain-containing protein n=1 Tax=Gordonia sp. ABSL1-1 TaxID=3053923 RepID=UPI002573824A|nr:CDGSH iron-sulfur domain-containing protein [Gordonia sp. ABSL1-1]MDL9935263.1 CDGSH iron-sulfur domain-containing protein [Gordonia sp. ABSL1-1]
MAEGSCVRVRLVRGGPLMVPGPVDIELSDGTLVHSDRFMVALCACGRSRNYPLCDTSHRRRCRGADLG